MVVDDCINDIFRIWEVGRQLLDSSVGDTINLFKFSFLFWPLSTIVGAACCIRMKIIIKKTKQMKSIVPKPYCNNSV